jgi:PAS domain S-box-containing protein
VCFLDQHWHCTYVNDQATRLLGKRDEELLDRNIWEVFPQAVDAFYPQAQRALTEQIAIDTEVYYPSCQRWFAIRYSPSDEGVIVLLQDISERKRQEELSQFQATILANIQESVIVTNLEGTITYWNKGAERIFGYTPSEALGKTPALLYPTLANGALQADLQYVLTGEDYLGEWEGQHKDGTLVWIDIRTTLLRSLEGVPIGFLGLGKDITLRKQAEALVQQQRAALQHSQEQARQLIDANIIGVVVADSTHILEANDAFLEMVGYTQEDVKFRRIDWRAMTPPEFLPVSMKAVQELQEQGICAPFEKAYYRKDGSQVPILIGAARFQKDPFQWVCFVLDISERKDLEQRKDDFLSIASHELKAPLTTLKGFTQLLIKRLERKALVDELPILRKMDEQVNRQVKLIDELLDASKIQAGRLDYEEEAVDLNTLLQETIDLLQPASPRHTLTLSSTAPAITIGDKDRLGQVFTNLITNAIKYSPDAHTVEVTLSTASHTATIRVRDYGVGIPQAHLKHVFERFYRAYDSYNKTFSGLGMGLYIANEIVKRHGGELHVESEEGKGSTFIVLLPLKSEPAV